MIDGLITLVAASFCLSVCLSFRQAVHERIEPLELSQNNNKAGALRSMSIAACNATIIATRWREKMTKQLINRICIFYYYHLIPTASTCYLLLRY